MRARRVVVLGLMIVCLSGAVPAQDEELPLSNWPAPPYWSPIAQARPDADLGRSMLATAQGMQAQAEALPSSPLPFVAIQPCRIVDTRVAVDDGFHRPSFGDGESRTFALPASPDCTGLPATAGAWSLNIQFRPISQLSFLTAYPTGTVIPGVSTLTAGPAAWVQNAAVVPAGTGGAIDIYCQYAGRVVIDVNGYYGPHGVVTSLNALTGDLTLAEGSNIAITPSGSTLTIAMTGVPGGTLPAGTANQTLRSDGAGWLASSALTNDGTDVGVAGLLRLLPTSATTGQILFGSSALLHAYGSQNVFLGFGSGNFTTIGYSNAAVGSSTLHGLTGGYHNVAVGQEALKSDSSGSGNTAVGFWALRANSTADLNTAFGWLSLAGNTVGTGNVAVGSAALSANTTASLNTAVGQDALGVQAYDNGGVAWESNNTAVGASALGSNQPTSTGNGNYDTAVGADSMAKNTTGWSNTAVGYASLWANTVGFSNTAVGANALNGAAGAGSYNTAVGFDAGAGASGSSNVLLGFGAGFSETGSNRLHIANSRDTTLIWGDFLGGTVVVNDTATTLTGAGLDVNGVVKVRAWAEAGLADVCRDGTGVLAACSSDARLKTNVVALAEEKDVLAVLTGLRGVAFDWDRSNPKAANAGARREIGFVAQEVEAVLPEVVHVEADGYRSMDYAKLTALLVEVAKAQQAEIEELRRQVRILMEERRTARH